MKPVVRKAWRIWCAVVVAGGEVWTVVVVRKGLKSMSCWERCLLVVDGRMWSRDVTAILYVPGSPNHPC